MSFGSIRKSMIAHLGVEGLGGSGGDVDLMIIDVNKVS